jgi:hypothetical protein
VSFHVPLHVNTGQASVLSESVETRTPVGKMGFHDLGYSAANHSNPTGGRSVRIPPAAPAKSRVQLDSHGGNTRPTAYKTQVFIGNFGGGKPVNSTASTGFLKRAMGIEPTFEVWDEPAGQRLHAATSRISSNR